RDAGVDNVVGLEGAVTGGEDAREDRGGARTSPGALGHGVGEAEGAGGEGVEARRGSTRAAIATEAVRAQRVHDVQDHVRVTVAGRRRAPRRYLAADEHGSLQPRHRGPAGDERADLAAEAHDGP